MRTKSLGLTKYSNARFVSSLICFELKYQHSMLSIGHFVDGKFCIRVRSSCGSLVNNKASEEDVYHVMFYGHPDQGRNLEYDFKQDFYTFVVLSEKNYGSMMSESKEEAF